jgi:hypothetical protein
MFRLSVCALLCPNRAAAAARAFAIGAMIRDSWACAWVATPASRINERVRERIY